MTTFKLDGEIVAALTDLTDARYPDYFDDAVQRAVRNRQRPAWTFPQRWLPEALVMDLRPQLRLAAMLLLVASLVTALLAGGLIAGGWFDRQSVIESPHVGECPASANEADARDGTAAELSMEERAWRPDGEPPASDHFGAGRIVAWAYEVPDAPLAIVAIDPATGEQCRLISFSERYALQAVNGMGTGLDWSPTGDALAIGLQTDAAEGRLFILSSTGLTRVWTGEGYPKFAWSPDGSAIAVWGSSCGPCDQSPGVSLVYADGSADRRYAVHPWELHWSPDGTTWVFDASAEGANGTFPAAHHLTLVSVADGSVTPLDLGIDERLITIGWLNEQTLLVDEVRYDESQNPAITHRYLSVPIDRPADYSTLSLPSEVRDAEWTTFSPDLNKAAFGSYEGDGPLSLVDLARGAVTEIGTDLGGWPGLAWAPDGTRIAVTSKEPARGISIVNIDGTGLRQLASGGFALLGRDPWHR